MSTPEYPSTSGSADGAGETPVPPAYTPPAANTPPAYTPPPAYPAPPAAPQPPAYAGQPGAYPPPAYPQQPPYGAGYGYAGPRTNVLAVVSMIASILGFVWILPLVGSVAGAIMGHIALKQVATTGEKGRGMALAGVIVGWVGLGIVLLGGILIALAIFGAAASSSYTYN